MEFLDFAFKIDSNLKLLIIELTFRIEFIVQLNFTSFKNKLLNIQLTFSF